MPHAIIYINSWPGVDKDGIADVLADMLRTSSRETFVWSSTRMDGYAQAALANGADTPRDQRLRAREEFLRGLVEDHRTRHHIYIFTDFETSNPQDAMVAEAYRSAAITRDDRAFISVVLRSDSAEHNYRQSLPTETVDTAGIGQSAQLYRFGTPEEIEVNVSQHSNEEVAEAIRSHVRIWITEDGGDDPQ